MAVGLNANAWRCKRCEVSTIVQWFSGLTIASNVGKLVATKECKPDPTGAEDTMQRNTFTKRERRERAPLVHADAIPLPPRLPRESRPTLPARPLLCEREDCPNDAEVGVVCTYHFDVEDYS